MIQMSRVSKCYNDAFNSGCRPDPRQTISEWADSNRYLSQSTSSEPGRYRSARTPYWIEPMNHLSPQSPVTEVVVKKGAQIGFSECGNNWIGAIIDLFPGPTLVVQPTGDTAKRYSKLRLSSVIADTPSIRTKVKEARAKDSGNTILQKEFPGGVLIITGANSAAGLRSMPIKNLFLDEIDEYPVDVGGQGNPIVLAEKRTATYKNKKKVFKGSTPTYAGRSHVDKEYRSGSQAEYYVPCPHCHEFQTIEFKNIHYKKEKVDEEVQVLEANLGCTECGAIIEEFQKVEMLAKGVWRHKYPERDKKSYNISSLYSPYGWFSWKEACQQYEDAIEDTEKMITFTNTVLGKVYESVGERPEWERLHKKAEDFAIGTCPRGVHVITAGIDVQKDRIEVTVKGWGKRKVNWHIEHEVIEGNPLNDEIWHDLTNYLENTQFPHPSGVSLPISLSAIDSGYCTPEVYMYSRSNSKVFTVKGHDRPGPILGNPTQVDIKLKKKTIKRGILVYPMASSVAKKELYGWLLYETPDQDQFPVGYCHYPKFGEEFFKQLTAEKLVNKKNKRNFGSEEWVKEYHRNEVLDCSVMARAAAYKLGIDKWKDNKWDEIANAWGLNSIMEETLPSDKITLAKPTINRVKLPVNRKVKSNFLYGS
jgi:phage terminase large subunit GpA-like protein